MTRATSTLLANFPAIEAGGLPNRPPVLFVHGAFVGHEPFRPWLDYLSAQGWRGIAPSRRGRAGLAPARAAGLTIDDYVEDTLRMIDALGEAPIVIGHSLGGLIAQKVAELQKARVIVLLSPAPAAMLTAQPVALSTYLPMMPKILAGRPIKPSPGGCSTIALNRMTPEACPIIHAQLVHESGKVYRQMIFGTYKVDFSKITCPSLVIGGRDDRIVSPALVTWTAKRLGVTPHILDGHAHWLLEEPRWENIARRVCDFLGELPLTRPVPLRNRA